MRTRPAGFEALAGLCGFVLWQGPPRRRSSRIQLRGTCRSCRVLWAGQSVSRSFLLWTRDLRSSGMLAFLGERVLGKCRR